MTSTRESPLLIPFRAYLDHVMLAQDRLRQAELNGARNEIITRLDASDRAVVLQLEAAEKALQLKSTEIERRLDMLNGEAGRLATVLAQSVPREVWEQNERSWQGWKTGVDRQLNTTTGWNAAVEKLAAASARTMWGVLGIGVTFVIFVLRELLK